MNKPVYILLNWINNDIDKLDFVALTMNPNLNNKAIEILKSKPNKINWNLLFENDHENVINLLIENPEKFK